jgi:cytosine/uracil/thiamine/allantoin permease
MITGPVIPIVLVVVLCVVVILFICRKGVDMPLADLIKLLWQISFATGVTAATFAYLFLITFREVPPDNVQNSNIILGFLLGTALTTFLGYYFGTSQSTKARPTDLPPNTTTTQTVTETSKADLKGAKDQAP